MGGVGVASRAAIVLLASRLLDQPLDVRTRRAEFHEFQKTSAVPLYCVPASDNERLLHIPYYIVRSQHSLLSECTESARAIVLRCQGMIGHTEVHPTMGGAMTGQTGLLTGSVQQDMIGAVTGKCLGLCSPAYCVAPLLTLPYRAEPYRDRPPSRDYRGRDPSFREPLPREAPIREVSPRDAPVRDMLPPAPVAVAPAAPLLPLQPASTIAVPPPEPQIDREKVRVSVKCT